MSMMGADTRLTQKMLAVLFVLLCLRPSADAAGAAAAQATPVTVRMEDYRFIPDHLRFRLGVLYRLHLVNEGKEIHEFTAPEFIAAIDLRNPDALGAYTEQFSVDPGKTKEVYFVPRRAGRYTLICADHDWAGMTGSILVSP